jgi:arylsulfatase A-like enzyme
VDREFGRLYDQLEKSGLLENSWLVFTSDHGEMFERGMKGHDTDTLYQPIVRIPLLIFEPGRQQGMDIHTLTSAVDLLPTLAHVTGHALPPWHEGVVLPPYASAVPDPNRNLYAMRATRNDPAAPLTNASTMLVKGRHKLVYYFGFADLGIPDHAKLFDVEADPEELKDLYLTEKDIAGTLLNELKAKLTEVNRPYE